MPLFIFKKLGLGEANPTTITLQLANRSLTHPRATIKDVLVKVDKFIFLANFKVLDMEEDKEVPIILGRPFLATGRAPVDVQNGELRLRVQDEDVTFNVFNAIKHPMESESWFRVNIMEAIGSSQKDYIDPLESSLIYRDSLPTLLMMKQENMYFGWTFLGKINESTLKAWDLVILALSLQLRSPRFLKRNNFHPTLGIAYLGESSTLLVIISSYISKVEEEKLLRVLREHKEMIGWSLADINGIMPSMCMHRILLEDDNRPTIEA